MGWLGAPRGPCAERFVPDPTGHTATASPPRGSRGPTRSRSALPWPAAGSPLWAVAQSGLRDNGAPYTTVLFFNGGMGATASKDGENVLSWPSNISSTPVEVAERNSPLFFHYKRMRPDSGGRGRFRGGLGQAILIESESARPIAMSFMAESTRFPAPGLAGGAA